MNKQNKKELEAFIQENYLGCRLKDCNFYLTNYEYPFENKQGWQLVDAGVELYFDDESILSICFDREWEVIDFFDKPVQEASDYTEVKIFPQRDQSHWKPFIDNVLEHIKIDWNWYQDFEENIYYIPQNMELEFVDGKTLVIAAVSVIPDKNNLRIIPDSEGEILIGFSDEIKMILKEENN